MSEPQQFQVVQHWLGLVPFALVEVRADDREEPIRLTVGGIDRADPAQVRALLWAFARARTQLRRNVRTARRAARRRAKSARPPEAIDLTLGQDVEP